MRARGWSVGVVAMAALIAGCGDEAAAPPDDTTAGAPTSAGAAPSTSVAETPDRSAGGGLPVRIIGEPLPGGICPGGQRPCLTADRDLGDAESLFVVVEGRLLDGVVVVDSVEPFDQPARWPDQCDGRDPTSGAAGVTIASYEDGLAEYNAGWISPTGVSHLRVVGEAAPHDAALAELGIADEVCVVGGARFTRDQLRTAEVAIWSHLEDLDPSGMLGGASTEGREDRVTVDVWRLDPAFRAELEELVDVDLVVRGVIEVTDGTIAELELALASVAEPSELGLERRCGDVPLPIGTAVDGLPQALDDEAISLALDAVRATAEEPVDVDAFDWRIASATEREAQLIGIPEPDGAWGGGEGFGTMRLERAGDDWVLAGFGALCTPVLESVGFETQSLALSDATPPDPASSTVEVLVNAVFCGRQPPDRRVEVVVVEERADEVALVGLADEFIGDGCAEDDWRPFVVELGAPLGDRVLVNGATDARTPLAPLSR
ncbi:MAG: hypothetical protein AAGF02_13960 [Actinomycetota bacterium]